MAMEADDGAGLAAPSRKPGRRRRAAALAWCALAIAFAASGCAAPFVVREVESHVCAICHRTRETTRTRALGVPVWRSDGPVEATQLSLAHDRHLAEEGAEHEHHWVLANLDRVRRGPGGVQRIDRQPGMEHMRTTFALSIVQDVAESDPDLAKEMYQAIMSDPASGRSGQAERLSQLSAAVHHAQGESDPADFWRQWWARNRRDYGIGARRRRRRR